MESTRLKSDGSRYQSCPMERLYTPRPHRHLKGTKENRELGLATAPHRRDPRGSGDSSTESKREPALTWCETPKLGRKNTSLRRRLLVSQSSSDGSKSSFTTPGETHLSLSFDSPDKTPSGPLTNSTLRAEHSAFSCHKRRLLFSQAVTSTLESGRSGVSLTPESYQSRCVDAEPDLDDSIIAGPPGSPQAEILTPLQTADATLLTPALEDSGFSSLGLDKSHDSSVDHDGSFQELVAPAGSSGREKRRSRLERQRRLSTLREGGSQSEDAHRPRHAHTCKDEVFEDGTPLSAATLKMEELTLTPALQVVHAISTRARQHSKNTSLEDLLRVLEEDAPYRPRLPLSGLIGRKMGLQTLDLISELRKRNLRHVLAIILSLLSAADIYRFGQVSEEWSDVISEDKRAAHRRKNHIRELKSQLEGGKLAHVPDADTRAALACRSALGSVQAQARTPHTHTSITPRQSSSKHTQFLQVAKTLFSDEFLKACPRCQHPAVCHPVRAEGVCSWSDCSFRFCTACLCALHGSRDCTPQPLTRRRSRRTDTLLPGSAQSKRNVRRL
uniref:F-box only protein 43 n=1 Tax=Danio rerio TaxID=7955 RepID=Q7SYI4_DANRE|nr:Zgc:66488 [Danio rerio]